MNNFRSDIKEILVTLFEILGWAWWVEIKTQNPHCTYYFGPFLSQQEAGIAKSGYMEDLEQEGALGIAVKVRRCKPPQLTIADDLGERIDRKKVPVLSGQI